MDLLLGDESGHAFSRSAQWPVLVTVQRVAKVASCEVMRADTAQTLLEITERALGRENNLGF